jgi:hypothetical protein
MGDSINTRIIHAMHKMSPLEALTVCLDLVDICEHQKKENMSWHLSSVEQIIRDSSTTEITRHHGNTPTEKVYLYVIN